MDAHKSNRTKFVSFSGIDGSGKSTQIEGLRASAEQAGMRVVMIRFWDDVARLKNLRETTGHKVFKGEKGVGSPEAPVNRRDKNVRSWYMTWVRLVLYFVDAWSIRKMVKKTLRSDADLAIFDRYTYDELANLTLSNPFIRAYVRLVMAFVPRPHISYVLDADPVLARARKPEYPLDFLHFNRQAYLTLSRLIGGMTIIPPNPVEDVKRDVLGHAERVLAIGVVRNDAGMGLSEVGAKTANLERAHAGSATR
jgi:thymidylate kinase